jgi:parvulin-like peptidyl-prolyl isomerase
MIKILTALSLVSVMGFARMIGGIAMSVDGEPITVSEIKRFQAASHLSKDDAINALVQQRLEEKALRENGIFVNDYDVDVAIADIAKRNSLSVEQFKKELSKQGLAFPAYKAELAAKIKKEKLYKKIVAPRMKKPDDAALKAYYNSNKKRFKIPGNIEVLEYSSKKGESLQKLQSNPMLNQKDIKMKAMSIDPRKVNPKLVGLLKKTPDSKFTPIINTGKGFVTFFVKGKKASKTLSFEEVKNDIFMMVMKDRENALLTEYFEKKKSEAIIKVVRKI